MFITAMFKFNQIRETQQQIKKREYQTMNNLHESQRIKKRNHQLLSPPLNPQRINKRNHQLLSPPLDPQRIKKPPLDPQRIQHYQQNYYDQNYYDPYDRNDRQSESDISIQSNLSKRVSLDVHTFIQIRGIAQLYESLINILSDCDENDSESRLLAPAIAVCVDYALIKQNYYRINKANPRKTYKMNYRMGKLEFEVSFFEDSDDNSIEEREIKISKYNITDLPSLSEVLVTGILLDSESIDHRLDMMKTKKLSLEFKKYEPEADPNKLIKNVFRDLFKFQDFDRDKLGWQKLVRYYLLGLIMIVKHKSQKKSNDRKEQKNNSKKQFNDQNLFRSLVNSKEIKEILINTINENYEGESQVADDDDFIAVNNKNDIKKEIVKEIKIASLLYFFVRYFGVFALISFRTPNVDYLNRMLTFKNLDEMGEHFLELSSCDVGVDFIEKNENYADTVIEAIVEVSKIYSIDEEYIKNSLIEINKKNDFIAYYNKINNITENDENGSNANSDVDLSKIVSATQQKYLEKLNGQLSQSEPIKWTSNHVISSSESFQWRFYEFETKDGVDGTASIDTLANDIKVFSDSLNSNVLNVHIQNSKSPEYSSRFDNVTKFSRYSNEEKEKISLYYILREFCSKYHYNVIYQSKLIDDLTLDNNKFLKELSPTERNSFIAIYDELSTTYEGNNKFYIKYLDTRHKNVHTFIEAKNKFLNSHNDKMDISG